MKFYSLLSEYVCGVPVDYERADEEKCLELLSHDAYTVIKDAVFAELSATLFLFHSLSLYIAIFHSLSHSHKREEIWCNYIMLAFFMKCPCSSHKSMQGCL